MLVAHSLGAPLTPPPMSARLTQTGARQLTASRQTEQSSRQRATSGSLIGRDVDNADTQDASTYNSGLFGRLGGLSDELLVNFISYLCNVLHITFM